MDEFSEPIEDRKTEEGCMKTGAIMSLAIGIIILIWFVIKESKHISPNKDPISLIQSFGAFGDFIAGVVGTLFSLTGIFLLYLNLSDQRENFKRERLENNFFEMIKFHRDNINEMKYERTQINSKDKGMRDEGRKLFYLIYLQFKEAYSELNHLFSINISEIYNEEYYNGLLKSKIVNERNVCLKQYAQIDIVYLIIFFGISKEGRNTIQNIISHKYKESFLKVVLGYATLKPDKKSVLWNDWSNINSGNKRHLIFMAAIIKKSDKNYTSEISDTYKAEENKYFLEKSPFYKNNYTKYYGGYQFILGHYFRHFYQTVTFIDKETNLTYDEKYQYIKIFRGQLSNYEQIIFFLNSLSEIGRTWEFEKKKNPQEQISINKQLITKYNLIKNIPNDSLIEKIKLTTYYPCINYEAINNVEGNKNRKLLIKHYK